MSHTVFAAGSVIPSSWSNDVDTVVYTYFGNGTSLNSPTKLAVTQGIFSTSVITPQVGQPSGDLALQGGGIGTVIVTNTGSQALIPNGDTNFNLGQPTHRWNTVFTPIVDSGSTGSLSLKTNNGQLAVQIRNLGATAATFYDFIPNITGAPPILTAKGETNTSSAFSTAGTGAHNFYTRDGTVVQFQILDTASATRNITITGSNGGNPTIATTAGSPAIVYASSGGTGSATGHTLQMYEEGTWTPTVGGNATYTTQEGFYTRVGRLVYIDCTIVINAIGTGSTTVISGLPFPISNATNVIFAVSASGSSTAIVSIVGDGGSGGSAITLRSRTAASVSDTSANAIFANGASVAISGCYHT